MPEQSPLSYALIFSLIIASSPNVIIGIPLVGDFDGIGAMPESSISDDALGAFPDMFRT